MSDDWEVCEVGTQQKLLKLSLAIREALQEARTGKPIASRHYNVEKILEGVEDLLVEHVEV